MQGDIILFKFPWIIQLESRKLQTFLTEYFDSTNHSTNQMKILSNRNNGARMDNSFVPMLARRMQFAMVVVFSILHHNFLDFFWLITIMQSVIEALLF